MASDCGHPGKAVAVGVAGMVLELVVVSVGGNRTAPQAAEFGTPVPMEDFKRHAVSRPGSHEEATQRSVTAQAATHSA